MNFRPSGIVLSETTNEGRWIGWVVGVGAGIQDVRFGDVLELSKWAQCNVIPRPCWFFFRDQKEIPTGGFEFDSPDENYGIPCKWEDPAMVLEEHQILYRICRWDFKNRKPMEDSGFHPIADRVLAIRRKPPEMIGSLVNPHFMKDEAEPMGDVIATGPLVQDIKFGDRIVWESWRGTHINDKGLLMSIVRECDVLTKVEDCHSETMVEVHRNLEPVNV